MGDTERDLAEACGRRKFLAAMGAVGAAAIPVGLRAEEQPPQLSATAARESDYDVIVVGAGFSGVVAARDLRKSGLRTLVLEARNRLGGRTFDTHWNGHHIELGGAWVHWFQPGIWSEINRYGLEIFETPGYAAERLIVRGENFFVDTPYDKVAAELETAGNLYFEDARAVWGRPWDTHFQWDQIVAKDQLSTLDRLRQIKVSELQHLVMLAMMETCTHARIDKGSYLEMARWVALSGWNWGLANDTVSRYQIREGTGELIRRIAADGVGDLKLSAAVQRIEQRTDVALVTTAAGETYTAKAVIVALPMNCLANIDFVPGLAAGKISASRHRHAGAGFKFYAEVKGRHGKTMMMAPSDIGAGYAFTYEEFPDSTIFVGFSSNLAAFDPNDEESVQQAMRKFIPGIDVTACVSYSWVQDPFSLGTYCTYPAGMVSKWVDELGRAEGRIFMAGSDVTEGWRGFIDGAICRGVATADRVARGLVG